MFTSYDIHDKLDRRIGTGIRLERAIVDFSKGEYIRAFAPNTTRPVTIRNEKELTEVIKVVSTNNPYAVADRLVAEEEAEPAIRKEAKKSSLFESKVKQAVDPKHYQSFFKDTNESDNLGYQWLETMCRIQRYRNNPHEFVAAVELQVRKYLDRNGQKDDSLQELMKGLWYYKFMVAYIKNGCKPILVAEVDEILRR
jgi:hypothetical protein